LECARALDPILTGYETGVMSDKQAALVPEQGWHCLHLYYRIEFCEWQLLSPNEQRAAKSAFSALVQEVRALESTQLLTLSVVTPKADLGIMLITPDLHTANRIEKQLSLSLGAGVLIPVYSYLSLTEESEYVTTEEDHAGTLEKEENLKRGSAEFEQAMKAFRERMTKYRHERVYPTLPDWPVVCFYSMGKRRGEQKNWYALPYSERRRLMGGHAKVGRQFAGKVKQLITGSTGLDDDEWGVTLFAHDTFQIKAIVYQMRFDEVSADYGDFGEFYIGLQLPLDELFRRLQL
jgi:hydrogen peroxide-dependent heme synthase